MNGFLPDSGKSDTSGLASETHYQFRRALDSENGRIQAEVVIGGHSPVVAKGEEVVIILACLVFLPNDGFRFLCVR